MKALNIITLILIIVGGLNWGLVGFADVNFVTGFASLFGGAKNAVADLIYATVGLAALYQLAPLSRALSVGEVAAERGRF